jgi:hypothetical protein
MTSETPAADAKINLGIQIKTKLRLAVVIASLGLALMCALGISGMNRALTTVSDLGETKLQAALAVGQIQGAWRSVAPIANLDQWHHYAATFEGGLARLYVDGQEVAGVLAPDVPGFKSGSIPKTVTRFQSALNLGSNTIDPILNLDGDMDEFWYSPEAKSADWIRMAYETQKPR